MIAWLRKFGYALRGIGVGLQQERSCQVHLAATILVIAAAFWLRVSPVEGALLALCIVGVWAAELLNSALERIVRAMHQPNDPQLRDALDLAAGGVLIMSLGAASVGLLILGPRLWSLVAPG